MNWFWKFIDNMGPATAMMLFIVLSILLIVLMVAFGNGAPEWSLGH